MEAKSEIGDAFKSMAIWLVVGIVAKALADWSDKDLMRRNRKTERLTIEKIVREEELLETTTTTYSPDGQRKVVLPRNVYRRENWIVCTDKQVFLVPDDVRHFLLTLNQGDEVEISSSQPFGKKYREVEDVRVVKEVRNGVE